MTIKKNYKLEAARVVNKYFSEKKDVSGRELTESEFMRGFEFLDNAKAFLSDILPSEVLSDLSEKTMYAEISPSEVEIKETSNDILNKSQEFYVIYDMDNHHIIIADKSGNMYVNQLNSYIRERRVLQDLYKYIGDEGAYKQLGFRSV